MPNYVYGNLNILGDIKELKRFKEFAKGSEELFDCYTKKTEVANHILDMNKFIPYPQKFKDIDLANKEYYEKLRNIKSKVENGEQLSEEEKKIADELALIELGADNFPNRDDGYNSGGYQWCCANWGTKWNFGDVTCNDMGEKPELNYTFNTAWSVPYPVLLKMSEMFPSLTFEYFGDEESEAFEIEIELKAGKIIKEEQIEWGEIQATKIKEGNLDDFENSYYKELYDEVKQHIGHEIIYENIPQICHGFKCKTCNNKLIWDCNK